MVIRYTYFSALLLLYFLIAIFFITMPHDRYTEKISSLQISKLAQTARRRLSLESTKLDHNLRQVLGDATLLNVLEVELIRSADRRQ